MARTSIRNPVTRRTGNPSYIPHFKVEGDWAKTLLVTKTLDKVMMLGAMAGQRSAAMRMKRIARRFIRTNGGELGWPPLSPKYVKWKQKRGGSGDNLYVLSGLYYRSITVWQEGLSYYVGLKRGARYPGNNKPTLAYVARVLESGGGGVPPRPLWAPTFKELGGNAAIKGLMLWHVRDQIYKAYKIRAKVSI